MAMTPAYPGADAANDPQMGDDPSAMPQKDGYEICIACHGDGTFTVSVENGEQKAAEGGDPAMGAEAAEPAGVQCKTIKEALTHALEIHRAGGKMTGGADDEFQSGFGAQA